MNEREQQTAARMQAEYPKHALAVISDCHDGRPDWDYVCQRTYDLGRVHTTETVGYELVRNGWGGRDPDVSSMHVLSQKHECPSGSSRPWNYGC